MHLHVLSHIGHSMIPVALLEWVSYAKMPQLPSDILSEPFARSNKLLM